MDAAKTLRISLIQPHIKWEDKAYNIELAQRAVDKQRKAGMELVLFPEMSFTGFSMNTAVTGENSQWTVQTMSEVAKKNQLGIGFGWVRKLGDKCENVYSMVDKKGRLVTEYVKIHPFSFAGENEKFIGGANLVTFEMKGIWFTVFLCYDLRFPELFRLACPDVSAVILPACWPAKRAEHWKTLLRARAIENQVYIFAVNCQGEINGQYYSGDSCVVNPDGQVFNMLSNTDGAIHYDLIDDVHKFRSVFPALDDRRLPCCPGCLVSK